MSPQAQAFPILGQWFNCTKYKNIVKTSWTYNESTGRNVTEEKDDLRQLSKYANVLRTTIYFF